MEGEGDTEGERVCVTETAECSIENAIENSSISPVHFSKVPEG